MPYAHFAHILTDGRNRGKDFHISHRFTYDGVVLMGSTQPGRHRAAKHAAPKKSRRNSKKAGSLLGTAGLGIAALTSASSAPVVTAEISPVVPETPVVLVHKILVLLFIVTKSGIVKVSPHIVISFAEVTMLGF